MRRKIIIVLMALGWLTTESYADIKPTAIYMEDGTEVTKDGDFTAEAPLEVRFEANASSLDPGATLEWHFTHQGVDGSSTVTRYEENTVYTFMDAGVTVVALYVRQQEELVDSAKINVTIYDSHLEMPNAFTPNGDGANDTYSAKKNHKSIVEFHAYIFNRWGQKLYEWTDVNGEWDGTYNGNPVKDGVYFVLVNARGADGKEYKIRRDVNLIRRFNEDATNTEGEP